MFSLVLKLFKNASTSDSVISMSEKVVVHKSLKSKVIDLFERKSAIIEQYIQILQLISLIYSYCQHGIFEFVSYFCLVITILLSYDNEGRAS